jgi:hypothetical protein
MSIVNITFCGQLCETFNVKNVIKRLKTKTNLSITSDQQTILEDINRLLADTDFDSHYVCQHLLNKLVQITGSEYGFLGKIVNENGKNVLYTCAITNIAWNASSSTFFLDYYKSTLRFSNMDTLVGEVITSGKFKIYNTYDIERNIIPKGHPMIKRFMGVPAMIGETPIAMLGVCNKLTKYCKKDVQKVSFLLNLLSYLFIDISHGARNIRSCPFSHSSSSSVNSAEEKKEEKKEEKQKEGTELLAVLKDSSIEKIKK